MTSPSSPETVILQQMMTQATLSAWAVYVMNRIPALQNQLPMIKRSVAVLVAVGLSLGVHFAFDASAGTLMITGLTWTSLVHHLWDGAQSFTVQEFFHQSTKEKQG